MVIVLAEMIEDHEVVVEIDKIVEVEMAAVKVVKEIGHAHPAQIRILHGEMNVIVAKNRKVTMEVVTQEVRQEVEASIVIVGADSAEEAAAVVVVEAQ